MIQLYVQYGADSRSRFPALHLQCDQRSETLGVHGAYCFGAVACMHLVCRVCFRQELKDGNKS